MPQGSTSHAHHCVGDDHQDRRRDSGEHGGDDRGVAGAHVQGGQHQQGDHTRQHEQDPGDQPTDHPVEQPSDVDRQLLRLGPRQQGAEGQGMEKALLADPTLLVDQSVLHHRDLTSGAAEGLQRDREPGTSGLTQRNPPASRMTGLVGFVNRGRHGDFLPHRFARRNRVHERMPGPRSNASPAADRASSRRGGGRSEAPSMPETGYWATQGTFLDRGTQGGAAIRVQPDQAAPRSPRRDAPRAHSRPRPCPAWRR